MDLGQRPEGIQGGAKVRQQMEHTERRVVVGESSGVKIYVGGDTGHKGL